MLRSSRLRRAGSADLALVFCIAIGFAPAALAPARAGTPASAPGDADAEEEADEEPPPAPARSVGPATVTATRAQRDVLEVPGNVTVLERDEIERSGAADLPALLRREAGLHVVNTTTNPAGTQIEARGFNNGGALGSSLLVMVNGRRVNDADTGNTDWALLDIDRVERIEIVRGSASAVYGDNAVGGVVHILTRPEEGPPRFRLHGSTGSYDSGAASLSAAGSTGPLTASLFFDGLTTESYRDRSFYRAGGFEGNLEWKPHDAISLGWSAGLHADERRFPGALTREQIGGTDPDCSDPTVACGRRGSLRPNDQADVESWFVQGFLDVSPAEDVLLRVSPYFRERDDKVVLTALGAGETALDTEKETTGVNAQLQIDVPIGPLSNRLIVGSDFLRDEANRIISSSFGDTTSVNRRNVIGLFVQEELNLTEELLVSGGVRFDHAWYKLFVFDGLTPDQISPNFQIWSPKGAVTYRLLPPLAVYFSYAHGFRLPNFDEDAPILPFDPMDPPELPNLEPQRSNSFEVGATLESERVRGALALYWMNVRDEISFDPSLGLFGGNQNFTRVRHRGIEASLRGQLCAWLALYASYSFEDVEIRAADTPAFVGQRMPLVPRHRGTAGAIVSLPLWTEVSWNVNVVGSRHISSDFTHDFEKLGRYDVHDLVIAFRPTLGERWEGAATFALRNVLGERYSEFGATTFGVQAFNPAPTRSWEVGFVLRFRR